MLCKGESAFNGTWTEASVACVTFHTRWITLVGRVKLEGVTLCPPHFFYNQAMTTTYKNFSLMTGCQFTWQVDWWFERNRRGLSQEAFTLSRAEWRHPLATFTGKVQNVWT